MRVGAKLRRRLGSIRVVLTAIVMTVAAIGLFVAAPASSAAATSHINSMGELDCNGNSPVQQAIRASMPCTDIRGSSVVNNANTWSGKFYDNGRYIGHDEPDMTFLSSKAGSGNNVTWNETLPIDPTAAPTVGTPGSDVTHWFELSIAPWFSMAMCDPNSYPLNPCSPQSDSNAPTCSPLTDSSCASTQAGAGSAFMEMQFYPPGFAPFADSISCNNKYWCAALTIDSLECTSGFASCNNDCIEPVNFAFIQTNGVPTGPPSPQKADLATFTPNSNTLMMSPGDKLQVHMADAVVPKRNGPKQYAFEVTVTDLTSGVTGYMQASAANGFQNTSISDCSGTPFNFQPEYNTAAPANIVPWAALATDISTEYEIGHFEPCTTVTGQSTVALSSTVSDTYWKNCQGPYETSTGSAGDGSHVNSETSDAPCFPAGDTHGGLAAPNEVSGCLAFYYQNGDLDFDGTPYWPDWPTSTKPSSFPGSLVQSLPTTSGSQYQQYFVQTDVALSESSCTPTSLSGCAVPPTNAPGAFYPYWTRTGSGSACKLEFGNVSSGNTLGGDAQYGTNQFSTLGYPEFESQPTSNSSC
ncbi:MAG: hypothetical protein ACYCO3_03865 [Mycobacteriales bacterium]